MTTQVAELVKQIKRSFRLYMNGVTAASMRNKGLDYKINWGISQMNLRSIAAPYVGDDQLAEALWHDASVRECRILATIIMPEESMTLEHCLEWSKDIANVEIAEVLAFNLFQHVQCASQLSANLLEEGNILERLTAYNTLCRLVRRDVGIDSSTYDVLFKRASIDMETTRQNTSDTLQRQLLHAIISLLDSIDAKGGAEAARAETLLGQL